MIRTAVALSVVMLLSGVSLGIINPNFTPKHLVDQADLVLPGSLAEAEKTSHWKLAVTSPIKGESDKPQVIGLEGCKKDHAEDIRRTLSESEGSPAVLYSGTLNAQKRAYLHVRGLWLDVKAADKGRWDVQGYAAHMSGTYAGGTDKLIAMSKYIANDPDADVPVGAGVRWLDHTKAGKVEGRIAGMAAVGLGPADKKGRRVRHLFVASDAGDRLYRVKKGQEAMVEVTAEAKLDTKRRCFAWMDLNGDGLADLLSAGGDGLTARLADAKGVLRPAEKLNIKLQAECIGLAPCSLDGKPGVLVSTPGMPVLLTGGADAGWKRQALPEAEAGFGRACECVVADLDNDGFVDVLQPGAGGGVLWKGAAGGFAKPVKTAVATGGGPAHVTVGDFDQNGFLDVLLVGRTQSDRNALWENDGKAGFTEVFRFSGSMSYKCHSGAKDVKVMDLNHDGRPDVALAYPTGDFVYHWNRGFGAFGEEGEVRLEGTEAEPGQPPVGQQAIAAGDFNGDAARDLAVLMGDGMLRVYFNDRMDMPGLELRLPKGVTGPVTASCWIGEKYPVCTGTRAVYSHAPPAYVSVRYRGKCLIRYRFAGKPRRSETVVVGDGPKPVVLGAPEKAAATK